MTTSINENGSATLELTLLTPLLLSLLMLVVAGGRVVNVRGDLDAAVRDGARAASLARTPGQARIDGTNAVDASLSQRDLSCVNPTYEVDTTNFHAGGSVAVKIDCSVSLSDLTMLPLRSDKRLSATFTEVVDTFRVAGP